MKNSLHFAIPIFCLILGFVAGNHMPLLHAQIQTKVIQQKPIPNAWGEVKTIYGNELVFEAPDGTIRFVTASGNLEFTIQRQ